MEHLSGCDQEPLRNLLLKCRQTGIKTGFVLVGEDLFMKQGGLEKHYECETPQFGYMPCEREAGYVLPQVGREG